MFNDAHFPENISRFLRKNQMRRNWHSNAQLADNMIGENRKTNGV